MASPAQVVFEVSTTSEQINSWEGAGQAPQITMNGEPFGALAQPGLPSGFQVLALDATGDLSSPDGIMLNEYVFLQNDGGQWGSTYEWMYSQMIGMLLNAGNYEHQLLFLASFGLDVNMPPTNDGLQFLLERGAGSGLQTWETAGNPGSQEGAWISSPASYILVGNLAYAYGQGTEAYAFNAGEPAPVSVSVTFQNNIPPT
jgi:hypothetical protein